MWKFKDEALHILHPTLSFHLFLTLSFLALPVIPSLNDPDAFLSRLYGDYMAYPKKIGVGHSMFLNLSNKEKEVIQELISSLKEGLNM